MCLKSWGFVILEYKQKFFETSIFGEITSLEIKKIWSLI